MCLSKVCVENSISRLDNKDWKEFLPNPLPITMSRRMAQQAFIAFPVIIAVLGAISIGCCVCCDDSPMWQKVRRVVCTCLLHLPQHVPLVHAHLPCVAIAVLPLMGAWN
jgi:hypothetical protein